jgi:putative membrane protein
MNALSTVTLSALLAAAAAAGAAAQTQTQTSPDPSAASSPHQRQSTNTGANEAAAPSDDGADPSAASSPHQQGAMKNSMKAATDGAVEAGSNPATFVKTAALDGMTEVEFGKLAASKSSNSDVKRFAQKMVQDHEQANQQLTAVARSRGLPVPTKLDAKHEAMVKELSAKSGAAFDSAYASHMAKAHTRAVALFEAASQSSDPEVAAFAKKTLPTLQEHEQLANNLNASVETRTASAPAKDK